MRPITRSLFCRWWLWAIQILLRSLKECEWSLPKNRPSRAPRATWQEKLLQSYITLLFLFFGVWTAMMNYNTFCRWSLSCIAWDVYLISVNRATGSPKISSHPGYSSLSFWTGRPAYPSMADPVPVIFPVCNVPHAFLCPCIHLPSIRSHVMASLHFLPNI